MNMFAGSIANSLFFYIYSDGKRRYNYDPNHPYSLKTVLISLRAGVVSMTLTAPLWTIKTREVLYREQTGISVSTPISNNKKLFLEYNCDLSSRK